jgi:FkbM family methyltransferase
VTLLSAALGARVIAFEPDPGARRLLAANIAANPRLAARIDVRPQAVGVQRGILRFGSPKKSGDSMGSILLADHAAVTWEAAAITPGDVAALLGEAERVVLKIDTEGAEYALVPALGPLLGRRTEAAIVAFHPRILARSGGDAASIDRSTEAARSAFSGFAARTLDLAGAGAAISTADNSTVLFQRSRALA